MTTPRCRSFQTCVHIRMSWGALRRRSRSPLWRDEAPECAEGRAVASPHACVFDSAWEALNPVKEYPTEMPPKSGPWVSLDASGSLHK